MHNVVLIIHLVLALCLIAVVLLQRSEGGALGIGGGGLVSQRGAATALTKMTWALAAGFLCTSVILTILAGGGGGGSVFDRFDTGPDATIPLPGPSTQLPAGGDLLPPAETAPAAPAPAPAPSQ